MPDTMGYGNTAVPSTVAQTASNNPYLPQTVGMQQVPTYNNTVDNAYGMTGGTSSGSGGSGPLNIFQQSVGTNTNGQANWIPSEHDFVAAMYKGGYSAGDAALLYNFISSGAGFNSQVAQGLMQSMQPQLMRGEADIMEQFSGQGLRGSSSAAIGMGDYMSQFASQQEQTLAQMYENSVQAYMDVLLSGKQNTQPKGSTFQNIMQWVQTSASVAAAAAGGG